MDYLLRRFCGPISLGLALFVAIALTVGVARSGVLPVADGEGYAARVFALDGFLHAGQWSAFWELLVHPGQSILPLHAPLFFLLPRALAGTSAYLALQNLVTFGLLALGVLRLCRAVDRPQWAPAILLLCAMNNVALIDFYAFFLDPQFLALGLCVIALQVESWRVGGRERANWIVGAGLGLLFLLKPANALIFLATYALSEGLHAASVISRAGQGNRTAVLYRLAGAWGRQLAAFVPLLAVAFALGAGQTILQLLDQNEIHVEPVPIAAGGLLRLLYFPLCLASLYHVLLVVVLLAATAGFQLWRGTSAMAESSFPWRLIAPVLVAYFVLGEFFSFWPQMKPMRALLLELPLLWVVIAALLERWRVGTAALFMTAAVYAALALAQKEFDLLDTRDQLVEENYQLAASSVSAFPSSWHATASLKQVICARILQEAPATGVLCVNSIEVRNALAWQLENASLLAGETPPVVVRDLFNYKGEYDDRSLVGAKLVVLVTFAPVQSSRAAWLESEGLLAYGNDAWCSGPQPLATVSPLPSISRQPVGYVFVFAQPLTPAQVDAANAAQPLVGLKRLPMQPLTDPLYGRHYSGVEAWTLLKTWVKMRF